MHLFELFCKNTKNLTKNVVWRKKHPYFNYFYVYCALCLQTQITIHLNADSMNLLSVRLS